MPAGLLGDVAVLPTEIRQPASPQGHRGALQPEAAYDALARLTRLRAELAKAASMPVSRWKEARLFFFDPRREAQRLASQPPAADFYEALSATIAVEIPLLSRSVELRRVARALDGLSSLAQALGSRCPAAQQLADVLAVPDDEVVLVLHPELRLGYRLVVQGVADVGQFHVLLASALLADPHPDLPPMQAALSHLARTCENRQAAIPAGIPLTMPAAFQLYNLAALGADGSMPGGFSGCANWLWPEMPLSVLPRIGGERVVLLGAPAYQASWDVCIRFPGMAASAVVKEELSRFRVAEELSRLSGQPMAPARRESARPRPLSRAA